MESKHDCHVTPAVTPIQPSDIPESGQGEVIRVALDAKPTEWTVASGTVISGYGYNGQVPGPVIEAKQGLVGKRDGEEIGR